MSKSLNAKDEQALVTRVSKNTLKKLDDLAAAFEVSRSEITAILVRTGMRRLRAELFIALNETEEE